MQRRIEEILKDIQTKTARSAWDKGVREYAEELFEEYVTERLHITDPKVRIGKITEADLLNGADNWHQYSWGGCSLIYDSDICERLCTEKQAQRYKYGERKPGLYDTWLDAQSDALRQAARVVIRAVNRRD